MYFITNAPLTLSAVTMSQYLNLLDGQVQESVFVADADETLWSFAAHAGAQTSVQFHHGQFIKTGRHVGRKTLQLDLIIGLDL